MVRWYSSNARWTSESCLACPGRMFFERFGRPVGSSRLVGGRGLCLGVEVGVPAVVVAGDL